MRTLGFSIGLVLSLLSSTAEAQHCLHGADERATERTRRLDALRTIRDINSAQMRFERERGTYVDLGEATNITRIPLGFVFRLTLDRWGYAVSAKDTLDPCGFTFFSDQDGVVYEARPASETSEPNPAPSAVPSETQ